MLARGCMEATRAPRRCSGSSADEETAPLVWVTTRPVHGVRARASSRAIGAISRSGVARITSGERPAASTFEVVGWPPPMKARACLAERRERQEIPAGT